MSDFSTILFATPSGIEGAARIFDWGNLLNEYNRSSTPEQADELALFADWNATGKDIRLAMKHRARAANCGDQKKQAD